MIEIDKIRLDGGTQMREAIDAVTVATYAGVIEDGGAFPPVVVFYDGADYWLADGFHRLAAHKEAGEQKIAADVRSGTRIDAVAYAMRANHDNGLPRKEGDYRRAYQAGVREGMFEPHDAAKVAEMVRCSMRWARYLTKEARDAQKEQRNERIVELHEQGLTQREIAREVGVDQRTISRRLEAKRNTSEMPQNLEPQPSPEPTIEAALEATKEMELEQARAVLAEQEQAERERKKAERQAAIEAQRKAIEEAPSLNEQTENAGLFDVIVLDPPWAYGREYDPQGSRVANPYPEMSQAELLEIIPPAKDNAVIFLWTTHQFIFDAKDLLDKWGFTYKATLVWNKEKIGMGRWLRMQCEFCLVGIKGKPFWENTTWRDIIHEPRREHSRKPEAFYEMVEAITAGRKLEYFARSKRAGWEVLGNDTSKF